MATRRCKHGRKKTARKGCKSKPGPKKSRRRRRSSKRKCKRGMKKGSRSCKRKPGPKRSRKALKFRMQQLVDNM